MNLLETIAPKSDQLNADDLIAGPRTITITRVVITGGEQSVSVFFQGDNGKPWKPSKSMRRALIMVFGEGDNGKAWTDKRVTLFRNEKLKFDGCIGGIQFSHASGLTTPMTFALTMGKGRSVIYTVKPLTENFDTELSKLTAAKTEEELKAAFLSLSLPAQKALTSEKDRLKISLTTTEKQQ